MIELNTRFQLGDWGLRGGFSGEGGDTASVIHT